MKYLKPIYEWSSDSNDLQLPKDDKYAELSREELLALANSAIAAEDFQELAKINAQLAEDPEITPAYINTYESWNSLQESVQVAKQVLQTLADKEIKDKLADLQQEYDEASPEEKKERITAAKEEIQLSYLRNPEFLEIQRLLHKTPGYIGAFVKFRFLQGASMEQIRGLAAQLTEFREYTKSIPIERYADQVPTAEDGTPGWEYLFDEFNRLSQTRRGRWIVDALLSKALSSDIYTPRGFGPSNPVNQKELWKSASSAKQDELLSVARDLNDLDKPEFIRAVRQALGSCDTLDKIIDVIKTKIKVANSDRGKTESDAMSKYPSVAILYSGPDHLVLSFRNDINLPDLCPGGKEWCINPVWAKGSGGGRFWSYATGSLQLAIIDYSVDPSSPFHTVGITVNPNRNVSQLCDARNMPCISGPDYRTTLLNFKTDRGEHAYPKELVDAIDEVYDRETEIKSQTDAYYKEFSKFGSDATTREKAMVTRLEGIIQNFGDLKGKIQNGVTKSDLSINSAKNIEDQIIAQELSSFKESPVIVSFRKKTVEAALGKGLHSPAEVRIFDLVMKDSPELTASIIKNILEINQKFLALVKKNTANAKISQRDFWDNIINGIQDATTYLEKLELELKNK